MLAASQNQVTHAHLSGLFPELAPGRVFRPRVGVLSLAPQAAHDQLVPAYLAAQENPHFSRYWVTAAAARER